MLEVVGKALGEFRNDLVGEANDVFAKLRAEQRRSARLIEPLAR